MDQIEDSKQIVLPQKRESPSKSKPAEPAMKKIKPSSDSETEVEDSYLDELEAILEKKLGPSPKAEDLLFMQSPHDSILQAEGRTSENFQEVTNKLGKLEDGEELIQFAEFLTATKA